MASGCAINSACSASRKGITTCWTGCCPDDPREEERLYPDVPPAEPQRTAQHRITPLRDEFIDRAAFDSWFAGYRARLRDEQVDDAQRQQRMQGDESGWCYVTGWRNMGDRSRLRRAIWASWSACIPRWRALYRSRGRLRPPPAGLETSGSQLLELTASPRVQRGAWSGINFPAWVWRSR